MQYALLCLDNTKEKQDLYQFLVDANELNALHSGVESLNDIQPSDNDDENMPLQLIYGVYKAQPFFDFPKSEIKRHILESINNWLVHIDGLNTIYLGIKDIELIDVVMTKSCGHCEKPHASNDVAFAALTHVPENLTLGNGKPQAKTAYLKWLDVDILTTLINRKGLFSFIARERRIKQKITDDNWKQFIDYKRAVRCAQELR